MYRVPVLIYVIQRSTRFLSRTRKYLFNNSIMIEYFVPLDDIIGDTTHLTCKQSEFYFKTLCVKTWIYSNESVQQQLQQQKPAVVAIHGGPAFPHGYILPLKLLADSGYSVIFYDQAGCGKSTYVATPSRDAPWLLTLEYYLEELKEVLSSFNLQQYYMFGSSWGSMIAQEFAVTKPAGLLGLILDGALADAQLYITSQWRDRISTLPTYSQNLLRKLTDQKQFDTPAYRTITEVLGRHFSCRVVPRPDIWGECIRTMNASIYTAMQGESEFTVSGVLENWSILDRLHLVDAPTLVVVGEFDSMTEECSQAIVDNIRNAWPLITIPRAGHCKLLDEPQVVVAEIAKFLDATELARLNGK